MDPSAHESPRIFTGTAGEEGIMHWDSGVQIVEVIEQPAGGYTLEVYRADGNPVEGYAYGKKVREFVDSVTVDQVEYEHSLESYRPGNVGIHETTTRGQRLRTVHIESADLKVTVSESSDSGRGAWIGWTSAKNPWFSQSATV